MRATRHARGVLNDHVHMAIDDAYRVFVEQRVRLLASTCDDHARFKATIISQNVAKLPAGAADGMEGAEIFAMFVTGKV